MTLGKIISDARKRIRISQKDLANLVLKDDGQPISPQYLNDIEHDHRLPSEKLLDQLIKHLELDKDRDYLYHLAGQLPADLRDKVQQPEQIRAAWKAFRRTLKGK